ncbi:hypothetical protein MXB_1425 [Myxobolus squamalis]|nr:hypothetical protein MXB_1425 [Myxobolus squamalis]
MPVHTQLGTLIILYFRIVWCLNLLKALHVFSH